MSAVFQPGRYWGKGLSQSLGKSKKKETPQFAITFDILGAINPRDPGGALLQSPGGQRTVYWYITNETMPYFLEDMHAIGFRKDSLRFLDPTNPHHHSFADLECELYCTHEQYQGKSQEKWKLSRPRGSIEAAPLEDSELRKLDALFGSGMKKLAGGAVKAINLDNEVKAYNAELQQPAVDVEQRCNEINAVLAQAAGEVTDDIPF